jgi:Arc/MetJ family transcription regulator
MPMRTTVDLDEKLVREVMNLLGVKTKRQAIRRSLEALVQQQKRERLRTKLGNLELDLSLEKLKGMRQDEG